MVYLHRGECERTFVSFVEIKSRLFFTNVLLLNLLHQLEVAELRGKG